MFQDFTSRSDPAAAVAHLAALRAELARRGLDGFVVPRADEHQGEYVAPGAERLAWVTGFTGSAGIAVVLAGEAALFVDGRYTVQAREQVDGDHFAFCHITETPPSRWLAERVESGARIGYDPMLHTLAAVRRMEAALAAKGASFVAVAENPVDRAWSDRPGPPLKPVRLHGTDFAGASAAEKAAALRQRLAEAGVDAALVTQPESVAWLANLRGADLPHLPVALGFAVLRRDGRATLFIDGRQIGDDVRTAVAAVAEIAEPATLMPALDALGAAKARVLVDPDLAAAALCRRLEQAGAVLVEGQDPIALPKAIKNATEIAGARSAQSRDGVALTRFLAWFDGEAPKGGLDEIAAATALEAFRTETNLLRDLAFDTISAAGPNAALPHYRVSSASNRPIRDGEIYLVDSGAQYEDGTTDVTRTVVVGTPSAEMRDRYTRVLKGHIAISVARFPVGTTGAQLDPFARTALWAAGLDFDHGTGHGIGSYLSVHEGPQRISKLGTTPLAAGMILSNEPGYYKVGAYGIRIENLIVVTAPEPIPGGDRPMHGFETITLAPYDRRLIDVALLTPEERAWIDAYHARVATELGPLVDEATRTWLAAATAPLGAS